MMQRLIRTAITAIKLYFLNKCFNNNFKHFRNFLFITVTQSSYISTFKFYLCSNFIISGNWQPTSIYLILLFHQTDLTDANKTYKCNTLSFFKLTSLFMVPRLTDLFKFFHFLFAKQKNIPFTACWCGQSIEYVNYEK